MPEEDKWSARAQADFYQGTLWLNGRKVWTCTHLHLHETTQQAVACARMRLKVMRKKRDA